MEHLYKNFFTQSQIAQTKHALRKSIFFLLVCVDPKTAQQCDEPVDVDRCITGLLYKIGGLNTLLMCQPELVTVMSLLQSAKSEYNSENFDFQVYRKLILDAGAEIAKLKEV